MKEKWCKATYRRQRDCKQKKMENNSGGVAFQCNSITKPMRSFFDAGQAKRLPSRGKESALVEAINVHSFFPPLFFPSLAQAPPP